MGNERYRGTYSNHGSEQVNVFVEGQEGGREGGTGTSSRVLPLEIHTHKM